MDSTFTFITFNFHNNEIDHEHSETVKYLIVVGDYGYSHNGRSDTSKGKREWRLRRCAFYLRIVS